jgi:hypothetical protein
VPAATLSIALLIVDRDPARRTRRRHPPLRLHHAGVGCDVRVVLDRGLPRRGLSRRPDRLAAGVGRIGIMTGSWTLSRAGTRALRARRGRLRRRVRPLGYLFDRTLIIGLAYIFVWEGILATAVAGIGPSSVWRIAMSAYADLDELPPTPSTCSDPVQPGRNRWGAAATLWLVLTGVGAMVLTWAVRPATPSVKVRFSRTSSRTREHPESVASQSIRRSCRLRSADRVDE